MNLTLRFQAVLSLAAILALAACEGPVATDSAAAPRFASSGPTLVECPSGDTASATGQIGSLGGVLKVRNNALELPALAVVGPHEFRLAEPASSYMEIHLNGDNQQAFGFQKPVRITIDYSRCSRTNIDKGPLSVWKIDPETKALLKYMGGVDNKDARTITFTSDSLSGYSIAN